MSPTAITPDQFSTFGELLKYLRRQARITQRELAIAVGYSDTQISRMEQNQRVPDSTTITALFVPALYIEQEPKWVTRLLELAKSVHVDGIDRPVTPHNLPVQLTNFVGREKEILEVKDELGKHRLVTLTGSGGTGKTRLSLQVAAELLDSFHEGVWFIELASLSNPDLIPSTILSTLGISEQQGRPALKVLEEYLAPKKLLLVLDNCEHLIADAAKVANAILNAAPNLKILASSREALGVKGELAWHVPSLSLPDPKNIPELDQLTQYEAVRLFIDRAALVDSHFMVTKDNAPSIAQICYRLDGIPLALELAAARVKMLSVDQISARLDDRFRLLTGGARTALPRQQTLRSMIDWSYDLLSEQEKTLFRRLAVFVGGWTLEAAESVCGGEGIESNEILDLLSQLVNKSLVNVEHVRNESRYHRLETIRQYAREKLLESGEGESLRQKHSDWFLNMAELVMSDLLGGKNYMGWLNQLENDLDNFRTALVWLLEEDKIEKCAWLASKLGLFWLDRCYFHEGQYWLKKGLENRGALSKRTTAHSLQALSRLLVYTGDYDKAIKCGKESVGLFRELNDKFELALAIQCLGIVIDESGDDGAVVYYAEALQLYRELNNKGYVNDMLVETGWENVMKGNYSQGFDMLEDCMKTAREFNEPSRIAYALFVLGICRWFHHEPDKSAMALKESLRLYYQLGNKWSMIACFTVLAGVVGLREQPEQAAKYIGVSDKGFESIRSAIPPAWTRDVSNPILASIHAQINDKTFNKAYKEGYSMTLEQVLAFALDIAND